MSAALVLIWLGTASSRRAHRADLDSWASARVVELRGPARDRLQGESYDPRLVSEIENSIDQARIAAGSLVERGALGLLDRVARQLRTHPELPQAAWLMAERFKIEAEIYARRPKGQERAAEFDRQAEVLEGARAESYTMQAEAFRHREASTRAEPRFVTLRVTGLRRQDRLYADGVLIGRSARLAVGEHHLRVVRGGRGIWAEWVFVKEGQHQLVLPVPAPTPCSADDIGRVTIVAGSVVAASDVACRAWAVAKRGDGAGIDVATCRGADCGPLLPWQKSFGRDFTGPPQIVPKPSGPSWTLYLLAGVGALAVTGVVLWQTGTFAEPAPGKTTWRYYAPLTRF